MSVLQDFKRFFRGLSWKSPTMIFLFIAVVYSGWRMTEDKALDYVIRSDGRGYYAYLPAIFIYNDPSYKESTNVERSYHTNPIDQYYLYPTEDGRVSNKYFPGVAIMQLPFFLLAMLCAKLFQLPCDGYSSIFQLCYYLGTLCYAIIGYLVFYKLYLRLFPDKKKIITWFYPVFIIAGPVYFYTFGSTPFSHVYTLLLFACLGHLALNIKERIRGIQLLYLGLLLGLIALIRPTNVTIVLLFPFLWGSGSDFFQFIKTLISKQFKLLTLTVLGFSGMISILFLLWKWQTGHWMVWSYNGEGFDFLHPHIWEVLFSFRAGIFTHVPLILISSLAAILLIFKFKQTEYYGLLAYFIINVWIFGAWWCWDYESPFSMRPLTEHALFLFIPIIAIYRPFIWQKLMLFFFFLLGFYRILQSDMKWYTNQRFTASSYFQSLKFWENNNHERWNFTQSCEPIGTCIRVQSVVYEPKMTKIDNTQEYALTGEVTPMPNRTTERLYFRIELEKLMIDKPIEDVFLVVDAYNKTTNERSYNAFPLFADKFEGNGSWKQLVFEGMIPDNFQVYDRVKMYLWNSKGEKINIRNFKANLLTYKK